MSKLQDLEPYRHLASLFDSQKFMRHLGVEITHLADGHCELTLGFDESWSEANGSFSNGIVGSLAENVACAAAATLTQPGEQFLTVEYKMNLLGSSKGDRLLAVGDIIKSGKSLKIVRSNVYAINGSDRVHCACAIVTLAAT
ncbi:MAG: PaaI family thioesterase [Sneathiella sp.]